MSIIISLEERVNIEPYRADLVPIENFNSIHNNHDLPDNRDLPISRFNSMREEDFDSMHSRAPIIQKSNDSDDDPGSNDLPGQNNDQQNTENNPEKASQDSKPPEDIPKPETILVGPFELVKEKIMAVPGLLRLIAVLLLFIMFICAVVGKGAAGAFKFQIFCWVLFTPLTVVFCLKDWHPDGPPEMVGSKFPATFEMIKWRFREFFWLKILIFPI